MKQFDTIEEYIDDKIKVTFYKTFYPSAILDSVKGSTCESIYNVCEKYKAENKLQEIYEIRCPNCADVLGIYEYYGDIPRIQECIKCGEENISRKEYVCVLYKIVR